MESADMFWILVLAGVIALVILACNDDDAVAIFQIFVLVVATLLILGACGYLDSKPQAKAHTAETVTNTTAAQDPLEETPEEKAAAGSADNTAESLPATVDPKTVKFDPATGKWPGTDSAKIEKVKYWTAWANKAINRDNTNLVCSPDGQQTYVAGMTDNNEDTTRLTVWIRLDNNGKPIPCESKTPITTTNN